MNLKLNKNNFLKVFLFIFAPGALLYYALVTFFNLGKDFVLIGIGILAIYAFIKAILISAEVKKKRKN